MRCFSKDISFDIHNNDPFDPQISRCIVQRRTRTLGILDWDEEMSGASALDSTTIIEDEKVVTEEISPEVCEAMTSLAKEVTGQPIANQAQVTMTLKVNPLKVLQ